MIRGMLAHLAQLLHSEVTVELEPPEHQRAAVKRRPGADQRPYGHQSSEEDSNMGTPSVDRRLPESSSLVYRRCFDSSSLRHSIPFLSTDLPYSRGQQMSRGPPHPPSSLAPSKSPFLKACRSRASSIRLDKRSLSKLLNYEGVRGVA